MTQLELPLEPGPYVVKRWAYLASHDYGNTWHKEFLSVAWEWSQLISALKEATGHKYRYKHCNGEFAP